jgi:hypothetical protein
LEQLEREMSLARESENDHLRQYFASEFFEMIAHLERRGAGANKPLHSLAKDLLEKRKRSMIVPLEKAISQFEKGRNEP